MKSKGQNFLDIPENRDWIIANYGEASTYRMAKYRDIEESTINAYIRTIGVENIPSVIKNRGLKPDEEYRRWLQVSEPGVGKIGKLWNSHTIAEIAKEMDSIFPAIVRRAKILKLPFDAKKKKEIADREEESRRNKFKNYVPMGNYHHDWGLNGSGCMKSLSMGAKCNGIYYK